MTTQPSLVENNGGSKEPMHNPEPSGVSRPLHLLWGTLLILAGVFFLVQNLGFFDFLGFIPEMMWAFIWMGIFGVAGLAFLGGLLLSKENWWMAIPGFALLGLSGTIMVSEVLTFIPFEGSIFLGSLGLGFLVVYLFNREMWWALIPGGVLSTLALVAALDSVGGIDTGAIFFLGLGFTFALVGIVPTPEGRMTWAWIPAGAMLLLAVVILTSAEGILNMLWPLILVGIGGLILFRNLIQGNRS